MDIPSKRRVFQVYTPKRPVFAKIKKTGFEKLDFTPGTVKHRPFRESVKHRPFRESVRSRKILKISHSEKSAKFRKIAFFGKNAPDREKMILHLRFYVGI